MTDRSGYSDHACHPPTSDPRAVATWLNINPEDIVIGPMQIRTIGTTSFPPRPQQSHKIDWRGEFWPPDYDPDKDDTWNGRWYPERPAWAEDGP